MVSNNVDPAVTSSSVLSRKLGRMHSLLYTFISAGLLICAYPRTDWWALAWIALVPLLCALDGRSRKAAFGLSYLSGWLFFAGTLYWFIHVTVLGAFFLISYLALYFGLFGWMYSRCTFGHPMVKAFALSCCWVVLEYLRARLFSGFDWVCLGHSQYTVLPLIQIAEFTGVFGISFLVIFGNLAVKAAMAPVNRENRWSVLLCAVIVLGVIGVYGFSRMGSSLKSDEGTLRVAVVQGNIEQERKWFPPSWPVIMKEYKALTVAVAQERPDIIIWPETSFPGYIWESKERFQELQAFVDQLNVPLVLGTVTRREGAYYNSALYFDRDGRQAVTHDKLHLVPFGEFLPLRSIFPFLADIVPIEDFTSGRKLTVFPGESSGVRLPFSVLICFEDTVADLSRVFTQAGAGLLINITNDAWFKDTKAPFLHMQSAVFRTVENRRGLIRAANTGVSCFIRSDGAILSCVEDDTGHRSYIAGFAVYDMALSTERTFYTRWGDVFVLFCSILLLMLATRLFFPLWKKKKG